MINKDKAFEIIEYSFSNGEEATCIAYSLSMETFNRYKREYKNQCWDSADLFMELKKQYTPEELTLIAKGASVVDAKIAVPKLSFDGKDIVFGAITDTHFGSIYTHPEMVSAAIKEFKNQGCSFMTHSGDVTEGMSGRPGHVYELSAIGYKAQKELAISVLKEWDKPSYYLNGNHDCLDVETECLTDSGWKKYSDIVKTDKILSYDIESDSCSWDSINDIVIQHRKEELVSVESRAYSFLGTKGHRVLGKRHIYDYFAADLGSSSDVTIKCASSLHNPDYAVSDDILRVVSWILADGSIKREKDSHTGSYQIWQSKYVTEIEELLNRTGLQYSKRIRDRDIKQICGKLLKKKCLPEVRFSILGDSAKYMKSLIETKIFPKWIYNMSDRQFSIFMHIVRLANGNTGKAFNKDSFAVYGTKEMLEQLQLLCVLHNTRAWLRKDVRGNYVLRIASHLSETEFKYNTKKSYKEYDGIVWCLSVPKTNFMVRRNGATYFTGNCWYQQKGDIGADIVADICEHLPNATCLGTHEGDININGAVIRLWHGIDGSSGAHSYRIQQVLASLDVDDIPDVLIAGHTHKSGYFYDRGCHALTAGCMQLQSGYMRYKRLPAHVGFYIIRMRVRDEKIVSFSPTYYPIKYEEYEE